MKIFVLDRKDKCSNVDTCKAVVVARDKWKAEEYARCNVKGFKNAKLMVTEISLEDGEREITHMEQDLKSKVPELEKEARDLKEKLQKEISEKYFMQSNLSKSEDMNKQLLKIIENLSNGIRNR